MCGIVGYVGDREAFPLITESLARLEYRGYDSAGVALLDGGRLVVRRVLGRVARLVEQTVPDGPAWVGLGHTRWATHGKPSVENAHPHVDCTNSIAVVHNGIIENHRELRSWLASRGHVFRSETDSEVVAHLIEEHVGGDLASNLRKVMPLLRGDYALGILSVHFPQALAAIRSGSPPLLIGVGRDEHYLASDPFALAPYTRDVIPLEDGDLAILTADAVEITRADGQRVTRSPIAVTWTAEEADRGGHPHFMHKEIHEQPRATRETFAHRVSIETGDVRIYGLTPMDGHWREVRRLALVGCGTSYHAALIARRFFERLARLSTDVDIGSEFRYRDPLLGPGDVCICISQSGETADTLGALHIARLQGARVLAVCNVPGSSLTRHADGVVMTSTGPEIGVASTKSFTAQLVALFLVALGAGRERGILTGQEARTLLRELAALPAQMEDALRQEEHVLSLATLHRGCRDFFFLGRGLQYPVALEGALKLKEIAYLRAEAFPAGEMKHGPLALIDGATVTLALAPAGSMHPKMLSTIQEVKARDGQVIALVTEGDHEIPPLVDHALFLPAVSEYLAPGLFAIPLQLFAYHAAVLHARDVDRPRNLAKSVTVE